MKTVDEQRREGAETVARNTFEICKDLQVLWVGGKRFTRQDGGSGPGYAMDMECIIPRGISVSGS